MEKCPDCGGDLIDGICEKCGYEKEEESESEDTE